MAENYFYHNICHWCTEGNQKQIRKCSSCRLVAYCSIEHQKNDWAIHKQLCKAVKLLAKTGHALFEYNGNSSKEWNQHRTKIMCNVELLLRRKLYPFERQMLMFPNVCSLCHHYNTHYYVCKNCQCTFYCTSEHLEISRLSHNVNCEELKLCFEVDMFLARTHIFESGFLENVINKFATKIEAFPSSIQEYILNYTVINSKIKEILISEPMSYVLTLLYGLFICDSTDLYTLSEIVIHVIGSSDNENYMIKFMETFFLWLPLLQQIFILMIGPDCETSQIEISCNELKGDFVGGKKLNVRKVNGLYHDFLSKEKFKAPHVVVAFNCGFSEFAEYSQDTWGVTIQAIFQMKNTLFIATSYTIEEAQRDYLRITKAADIQLVAKVIVHAERNPFRSLRPLRDWENSSRVFYLNNCISILCVK